MKKTISLLLALVLCLSLCACGAEPQENVAGKYLCVSEMIGYDAPIILNDDFTYDSLDFEKGTYKVGRNEIVLQHNNDSSQTTTLVKCGDFYYLKGTIIPLKDEYGQTVHFSKEGTINYSITLSEIGSKYDVTLTFHEDGTFVIRDEYKNGYDEYPGTYTLEEEILTLTDENSIYYLVCTEDGISKRVFKRYTIEDIKRQLMGKWQGIVDESDSIGYTFREDGTAVRHSSSGDSTYTYEVLEDWTIECVGSDSDDVVVIGCGFSDGILNIGISDASSDFGWIPFVKE